MLEKDITILYAIVRHLAAWYNYINILQSVRTTAVNLTLSHFSKLGSPALIIIFHIPIIWWQIRTFACPYLYGGMLPRCAVTACAVLLTMMHRYGLFAKCLILMAEPVHKRRGVSWRLRDNSVPATTTDAGSMQVQRQRRWTCITPASSAIKDMADPPRRVESMASQLFGQSGAHSNAE